jgi:glutamyl-tRNA synthetase
MSVTAYRDMGFLPDAFINYLVRLGWSHGDQEFFSRQELLEKFNLENIGKSAGVFDIDKLTALNADHIRATPVPQLVPRALPYFREKGYNVEQGDYMEAVIGTLHTRSKTLVEMADGAQFYYRDSVQPYDEKAAKKFLKPEAASVLSSFADQLDALPNLKEKTQEGAFKKVMESAELGFGKIAQPVRVALTGTTVSPGIFEVIEVLGKDRVLQRLRAAVDYIEGAG